jgi:hypothetical protein
MDIKREWVEKYIRNNDYDDEDYEWTERRLLIVPGCCEESSKNLLVTLRLDSNDIYENEEGQENSKPRWEVRNSFWNYINCYSRGEWPEPIVKFCPHCGEKMPEIQKRKEPLSPVCSVTDGGYYCDSCEERLHACKCWPCEAHWEVKV